MTNDSKTTDPRVEAGAKAWDKHMGDRYAPHEVEELAEEVAVILAAADAVDPRKHRTITTVEELDALPDEAVVRSDFGVIHEKRVEFDTDRVVWVCPGDSDEHTAGKITLPATVLREPAADATR